MVVFSLADAAVRIASFVPGAGVAAGAGLLPVAVTGLDFAPVAGVVAGALAVGLAVLP